MLDFALIPTAYAQFGAGPNISDLERISLPDVISLFAALAIIGIGLLSVVFIFFGGFTFILSGGDEGKVKQAVHTIRYAIVGLIMALLSFVIVKFVGLLFGVSFEFFDFAAISQKFNSIVGQLKTTGGGAALQSPMGSGTTSGVVDPANVPVSELLK